MKNTFKRTALALVLCLAMAIGLMACNKPQPAPQTEAPTKAPTAAPTAAPTEAPKNPDAAAPGPGEAGFNEIPIGDKEVISGPFQIAMVYFQGVDMVPEGKQPSAAESDMHLEADIHLTPEAAQKYGFGAGEDQWPAYLTVNYKITSADGKTEIASGAMMPMNAEDGPHYGINLKKDVVSVGKYKIILEIKASDDYLLHVDSETGVPLIKEGGKVADVQKYYEKQVVEFDWDYTAAQKAS